MKFKLWLVLFLLFANLCLNAESFELHNFDEIELKFIGVSIQNIENLLLKIVKQFDQMV